MGRYWNPLLCRPYLHEEQSTEIKVFILIQQVAPRVNRYLLWQSTIKGSSFRWSPVNPCEIHDNSSQHVGRTSIFRHQNTKLKDTFWNVRYLLQLLCMNLPVQVELTLTTAKVLLDFQFQQCITQSHQVIFHGGSKTDIPNMLTFFTC